MLKTVQKSANRKTGPIAVTYRAGVHETYATCPSTCALHPKGEKGGDLIDGDYLDAVREAVPAGGVAWTYSHFDASLLPQWAEGETVINASCDTVGEALRAAKLARPAVYVAPADTATSWPAKHGGVRFVRCPAELADNFTCDNCGGDRPLCARAEREYVVVFVAHGPSKAKIGKGLGGVTRRAVLLLSNGTAREPGVQRMTPRPCAPSRPRCPGVQNCVIMLRAT